MSPVDVDSMLYSSITPTPTEPELHPFVALIVRSFTCGECPEPYPEPPEPICVVNALLVPLALGRFAVTQISPVSVREDELST
jgi:hypothetical protein